MVEIVPGIRQIRIADTDGLDTKVYMLEYDEELVLVDVGSQGYVLRTYF